MADTNIIDAQKLIYEALEGIGIERFIGKASINYSENHIVINGVPINRLQVLSNNLINVNVHVKKIEGRPDLNTADTYLKSIYAKLESFNSNSSNSNILSYDISIESDPIYFDEDGDFGYHNLRVNVVTNNSKI